MFLKKIDFLSPEITLFYKGSLSHSSIVSGILTIIAIIIIIIISYCYAIELIERENSLPNVSSFTLFAEDASSFPINSSSFFHFIDLIKDRLNQKYEDFDFQSFNLIGLDTYLQDYDIINNLDNYNHWIYGYCNNESDTKGISHLITQEYFRKSACIKKYFDYKSGQYYDIGHPNFKWPEISHGTFNPNNRFYSVFLKKCDKKILGQVLGEEYNCKNDNEIEEVLKNGLIHFNFIENYINVLKYNDPIIKSFYRIENSLDIDNYSINHLNFNPSIIKTHKGFIFDKIEYIISYSYDRNDVFIHSNNGNIFNGYYLWLNNRANYFERCYKTIQDVLSNIGGVAQSVMSIAIFLNIFINKYIILSDIEELLINSNISINEVYNQKTKIKFKNKNFNSNIKNDENPTVKQIDEERNDITPETKEDINDKNNISIKKQISQNAFYHEEKNYKFEVSDIINNRENKEINSNYINNNSFKKISFLDYVKFSLGKKNKNIKFYENFREKIISVENLVRNHLNINNLIKLNDKNKSI